MKNMYVALFGIYILTTINVLVSEESPRLIYDYNIKHVVKNDLLDILVPKYRIIYNKDVIMLNSVISNLGQSSLVLDLNGTIFGHSAYELEIYDQHNTRIHPNKGYLCSISFQQLERNYGSEYKNQYLDNYIRIEPGKSYEHVMDVNLSNIYDLSLPGMYKLNVKEYVKVQDVDTKKGNVVYALKENICEFEVVE